MISSIKLTRPIRLCRTTHIQYGTGEFFKEIKMRTLIFALLMLVTIPAWAQQSVVVVFDDSSSMGTPMQDGSRMDVAKSVLIKVVSSLPEETRLGIVLLNGNRSDKWFVPFGKLNKNETIGKLKNLRENGSTPLAEAMKAGCDKLLSIRAKEHYGTYKLLVVTDGEADNKSLVDTYVDDINSRGIMIDAIGLDMKNHSLSTKVHSYRNANSPEQLLHAVTATFAETNAQDPASAAEDFAMIDSIPEGMAAKVISALGESDNHPIGEKPVPVLDESGNVQLDAMGNIVTTNPKSNIGTVAYVIIGGVVLLIFVIILIKSI